MISHSHRHFHFLLGTCLWLMFFILALKNQDTGMCSIYSIYSRANLQVELSNARDASFLKDTPMPKKDLPEVPLLLWLNFCSLCVAFVIIFPSRYFIYWKWIFLPWLKYYWILSNYWSCVTPAHFCVPSYFCFMSNFQPTKKGINIG